VLTVPSSAILLAECKTVYDEMIWRVSSQNIT